MSDTHIKYRPDIDATLRNVSNSEGVFYISPDKYLCKQDKCTSRVGDKPTDFISIDFGHFSKNGAEYFVDLIDPLLLRIIND